MKFYSIYPKRGILYLKFKTAGGKWQVKTLNPLSAGKYKNAIEAKGRGDWGKAIKIAEDIIENEKLVEKYPNSAIISAQRHPLSLTWEQFIKSKSHLRPKTISAFQQGYKYFEHYFGKGKSIQTITKKDIQDFVNFLRNIKSYRGNPLNTEDKTPEQLSVNTINNYLRQIRMFFNWLVEMDYITKSPVLKNKNYNLIYQKRVHIDVPENVINDVLDYLENKDLWQYRAILFMLFTSVHPIEVCHIRWEDVFFSQKHIVMRYVKTNTEHFFPLYKDLENFLLSFPPRKGKIFPFTNTDQFRFWKRALEKTGNEHYPIKLLRKTTITTLINIIDPDLTGVYFDLIHTLSGHTDPKTTWEHYRVARIKKHAELLSRLTSYRYQDGTKIYNIPTRNTANQ